MGSDFPDLLQAIADHAKATIPGLKQISYPSPSRITGTPCLIVVSGSDQTTGWDIDHEGAGEQMVTGQAAIQLIVARASEIAKEGALADRFAFPVTDAFGIGRDGQGVEFPNFGINVDRCVVRHWTTNAGMDFGGQKYVGVEFVLDIKFHRVWDTE